jgi:multidrug resistance efflux pump
MILFLILCYVAMLAILVKLKVIKLTLGWKLSPLLFGLVCFMALVLPMQWGAPSGTVNVYRYVVEIIPNVTGEVTDISIEPLKSVEKGDVLFQIDRRPFEAELRRLEAALAEAEQTVPQLEAALGTAQANLEQVMAQRDLDKLEAERNESLSRVNPGAIAKKDLDYTRQKLLTAEAAVRGAESAKEQARLAFGSEIAGENTAVAQLKAQLESAKLNLDWTTVRAPVDGYAMQVALRAGQRVASIPVRSWLVFVDEKETRISTAISQYQLRHVEVGQDAEIIFKLHPGRTFPAKVESILRMNGGGQMTATGIIQDPTATVRVNQPYGVILKLDDANIDPNDLPGGAIGTVAIYTDAAKAAHIIRRIELRMNTWLNYVRQ